MITLENCHLRRGTTEILHDVSFTLAPSRVTALIGPNGAGKSTALRIASGEIAPSSGVAHCENTPLARWSPRALARRRAVVSQRIALSMPMRVEAVVALGRQPWHGTPAMQGDAAAVAEAMERTGIGPLAARHYASLSGGEQQRVQIARALAQLQPAPAPRALLLDEPTANLDLRHTASLLRLIRSLAQEAQTSVLLVLHDLNEARFVADDVVVLHAGRVAAAGTAAEVLRPSLLEPLYGLPFREAAGALLPDYGPHPAAERKDAQPRPSPCPLF